MNTVYVIIKCKVSGSAFCQKCSCKSDCIRGEDKNYVVLPLTIDQNAAENIVRQYKGCKTKEEALGYARLRVAMNDLFGVSQKAA